MSATGTQLGADTAPAAEHRALTHGCGVVDRSERGKLALTGAGAIGFLNGQVTNELDGLRGGEGRYAAFLTHKGKMLGDLRVLAVGDDRAAEPLQGMTDDLRHARGARCQHQPLGRAFGLRLCRSQHRRASCHHQIHAHIRPAWRLVGHDGIDFGIFDQGLNVSGIEIGRAQQHSPCHAVDFRHGEA